MNITDDAQAELLLLLSEEAPPSGRLSQVEIEYLLTKATDIYEAASKGWLMKADKLVEAGGLVTDIELGSERYRFSSINQIVKYCQMKAEYFLQQSTVYSGGAIIVAASPVTIGVSELDALTET